MLVKILHNNQWLNFNVFYKIIACRFDFKFNVKYNGIGKLTTIIFITKNVVELVLKIINLNAKSFDIFI
jgi:hypothetical protein